MDFSWLSRKEKLSHSKKDKTWEVILDTMCINLTGWMFSFHQLCHSVPFLCSDKNRTCMKKQKQKQKTYDSLRDLGQLQPK